MVFFIFLKPIVDLFYSLAVLDYAMLLMLIVYFPFAVKKLGTRVLRIDICVMLLIAISTATFLRTFSGVNVYLKIVTGYMMYFLGRGFAKQLRETKTALVRAQIIVLAVNLICLLVGNGFTIWGNAKTFRGLYFYKSDLAIAMIQACSAVLFFSSNPFYKLAATLAAGIMILLANSRAAIIIYMVVLLVYFLFRRERVTKKRFEIRLKTIVLSALLVFTALVLTVAIISLPIFENMNFISFDLTNLFSTSNLQGRDNVWKGIFAVFNEAGTLQKLFGVDYVSDVYVSPVGATFDSHNSYVKLLFSTGYVGLGLYLVFLIFYVKHLNRLNDRALFYFCLSSLGVFLLQSISQASIAFTQMTWIWMYFAGVSVTAGLTGRAQHRANAGR